MSHDGWIVKADDASDLWSADRLADLGNYTSNVSPVWHTALARATGQDDLWLADTSGMTCAEAAPLLRAAADELERNATDYDHLVRGNGAWGDVPGALRYLQDAATQAETYADTPTARLHWWV